MTKKFELTTNTKTIFGIKLFQIKALISFGGVDKDELGGWAEKEDNISQDGNAWVSGNARVSGNAMVYGDAWVSGDARVSGNAMVYGDAWVYGDDYMQVSPIGSERGTLTAFISKDAGIMVSRGCFLGTIAEFEKAVSETHGDNEHGLIYKALIPVIKLKLEAKISELEDAV